jgi:HAD superfamily hydrolase (TIGR01509 family)
MESNGHCGFRPWPAALAGRYRLLNMALDAMIFDLDGTLVDTNAMHVEAFVRAFKIHGYTVPPDRIFPEIGKGGDNLVPSLIGKEADKKDGDAIRKSQPEAYEKLAETSGITVFPKATDLIRALRDRAIKTVLATSSSGKQLKLTEKFSGVEWSKQFNLIVSADDASQSKPAPDLMVAATKKLGMSPAQCAMIGDTPFDVISSHHAGIVCLGVETGGHGTTELLESGARAVWPSVERMHAELDVVLRQASPSPFPMTQKFLELLMRSALLIAEEAIIAGECPIGSVLALGDGTIIGKGFNRLNRTGDPTAHAELMAFADAAGKFSADAKDLILVSTLEPCVMCVGAAMEAGIDTVVYGLPAPADSGSGRVKPPISPECRMPRIVGRILAHESRVLFERWLTTATNPKQIAFVKQLLKLNDEDRGK